jgi:hypothetical protein
MKLNLILLTLCLLGGSLLSPTQAAAESPPLAQSALEDRGQTLPWQLVNSTAGQYVVDLPGTPAEQTSTSLLLERDLQWQMSSVTIPAVDDADLFEYYLVAYADVPRSLRYEFSQKDLLDAATASVVDGIQDEQLNATLVIEAVAFQGLPARLLTAQGLGQYFVATLSLTGDRFYLLLAIDDDQANFEHFFNSLSLVP